MEDEERLKRYVERHFRKWNGIGPRYPFPTVRRTAKSLRWSMAKVQDVVEGCGEGLMLTSYFTRPAQPLADHFVETL